jgi:hypothetical protein
MSLFPTALFWFKTTQTDLFTSLMEKFFDLPIIDANCYSQTQRTHSRLNQTPIIHKDAYENKRDALNEKYCSTNFM